MNERNEHATVHSIMTRSLTEACRVGNYTTKCTGRPRVGLHLGGINNIVIISKSVSIDKIEWNFPSACLSWPARAGNGAGVTGV